MRRLQIMTGMLIRPDFPALRRRFATLSSLPLSVASDVADLSNSTRTVPVALLHLYHAVERSQPFGNGPRSPLVRNIKLPDRVPIPFRDPGARGAIRSRIRGSGRMSGS